MEYIKVPDAVFRDAQRAAFKVWSKYNNEHGYVNTKISRVLSIENYSDNIGTIIGMFDINNKQEFLAELNDISRDYFRDHLSSWI